MDYEKKYNEALERARELSKTITGANYEYIFPELKESEDERIRELCKVLVRTCFINELCTKEDNDECMAWLDKQGKQKELNLVEILKHYPRETELYSPLYGKLWLAEVDEENEIITCYKYPLDEGCTRAILEQENTISFYSNGTTGLPDCTISKDCMLFLYNKNQSEQKPVEWSEEDEKIMSTIMEEGDLKPSERNWLKSIKGRVQPQSKQEWSEEDTDYVMYI